MHVRIKVTRTPNRTQSTSAVLVEDSFDSTQPALVVNSPVVFGTGIAEVDVSVAESQDAWVELIMGIRHVVDLPLTWVRFSGRCKLLFS
jgi:hypothetical protein